MVNHSNVNYVDVKAFGQESQYIGGFLDSLRCRLASAMARLLVDAQQNGIFLEFRVANSFLEGRNELERMQRADTIVVVGGQDQSRWVFRFGALRSVHIMQRRELVQVVKVLLLRWVSIIRAPSVANGELVEAQHIHDTMKSIYFSLGHNKQAIYLPNLSHSSSKQIRTLVDTRADQKASVGATLDGQTILGRVLILDQVLGSCLEVIEHVLLVQQATAVVPLLAIFATTSQIRIGEHTIECVDEHKPAEIEGCVHIYTC